MKGMGIQMDGCMEASIMPVNPDLIMIGTAMTVKTSDGDNFPIHVAAYQARPGYVMVIDGGDYAKGPYFGDLIMSAAQAVGVEGMVVNGYVRDRTGCLKLKFPVYAKGLMQRGVSKKNPGEINTPIECGGVKVNPGDLVIGDADGVTVVPREHIEKVLVAAEEKFAYEKEREKAIAAYKKARVEGKQLPVLAPKWVLDLLNGNK
jgi:regulator of RNase E activity RraA